MSKPEHRSLRTLTLAFVLAMACFAAPSALAASDAWQQLDQERLALQRSWQFDEAVPLAEKMLALAEREYAPEHPRVVESLQILAGMRLVQGRADDAGPLIERALRAVEKRPVPDHVVLSRVFETAGDWYDISKRQDDALAAYTRALEIRRKAPEPELVAQGRLLGRVASVHGSRDDSAAAEAAHGLAIETLERALRGVTSGNGLLEARFLLDFNHTALASIYSASDREAQAEAALTRALEVEEALHGRDSDALVFVLEWRADVALRLGKREQARGDLVRAAALHATGGSDSAAAANAAARMAVLAFIDGDASEAADWWTRVVDLRRRVFGERDPRVAAGLRELAALHTAAHATDLAKRALARAEALEAGGASPARDTSGRDERILATSLGEQVQSMLDVGEAMQRGPGACNVTRLWLRTARLRAAGPEPDRARDAYFMAMRAHPAGEHSRDTIPILEEFIALLDRVGDAKGAETRRKMLAHMASEPPPPARPRTPACEL